MKRIAIYTRRSIYSEESESINMQIQTCKDYFKREKCNFEIFIDEGFSGSNTNRPDFLRMRSKIHKKEFDTVVVYKIDRISRNMVDFINLVDDFEKYDVPLISVTEGADPTTSTGKFIMNILASVAEMERANTVQRVTDNMIMMAKEGRWTGGNAPIGYESVRLDRGVYLQVKEEEKELAKNIFKKYLECNSLNEVSRTFNINIASISDMLSSPVYVESTEKIHSYLKNNKFEIFGEPNGKGYLTYGKRPKLKNKKEWKLDGYIVSVSRHNPLIKSDDWLKVQTYLKKHSIEPRPKESAYSYLNTLVKCDKCKANMIIDLSYTRVDGTKVYSFRCGNRRRNSKSCNNGSIMIKDLESAIEEELENIGLNRDLINDYFKATEKKDDKKDISTIENKINMNNVQINNLTDKLALLSNEAAKSIIEKIEKLTQDNIKLQEKLLNFEEIETDLEVTEEFKDSIFTTIQLFNTMKNAKLEDKRAVIRTIIERIDFNKEEGTAKITLKT